jgi:hypothetical protein
MFPSMSGTSFMPGSIDSALRRFWIALDRVPLLPVRARDVDVAGAKRGLSVIAASNSAIACSGSPLPSSRIPRLLWALLLSWVR